MKYDLSKATDRALRHVDVSFDTKCPPEAFAYALATGRASERARPALQLFFAEGDEQLLVDIVTEGASTFGVLADLSRAILPPDHPTTLFLSEAPQ